MDSYRVREAFPQVEEIDDAELRETVVQVWEDALEESDYGDMYDLPWWPPYHKRMPESSQVSHGRDVIDLVIAIADTLEARHNDIEIDRDELLAAAVLHDVSKTYETSDGELTGFQDLMPHPHYGAHLAAKAGLSLEIQHAIIAHGNGSSIEPETVEAMIVDAADRISANSIFWRYEGNLKPPEYR